MKLPELDLVLLQQKANEAAQKGAEDVIKEYYNGYNSPYKKAIEEELKNKTLHHGMELPDIMSKLNDGLSKEIDNIANAAIVKSFIPLVKRLLTRVEGDLKFSDILKQVIKSCDYDFNKEQEPEDFKIINLNFKDNHFIHFTIKCPKGDYRMFMCNDDWYNKEKKDNFQYSIGNLPELRTDYKNYQTMKLSLDGATLEMPFVSNVLSDRFVSYCAQLIMSNTKITFDVTEFEDWLFPERHNCSCD